MSKHKHFHQIKTPQQLLQHGRREGFCPMYRPAPNFQALTNLQKKTAPSAANTEGGKEAQHDH